MVGEEMIFYKKKAFTLIELLAIIIILIILISIISGITTKVKTRSNKLQCLSNFKQLHSIAILYKQEHGSFPIPPANIAAVSTEIYKNLIYKAFFGQSQDLNQAICPSARGDDNYYRIGGLALFKLHFNSFCKKIESAFSPYGYDILFYDPVPNAHGDLWIGILENGKIIQDIPAKWQENDDWSIPEATISVNYIPQNNL